MRGSRKYCTFYLAGQCFGVDVLKVQEVLRYQAMTRVPLAPRVVRGLVNMRGQIVTALNTRRLLDMLDSPGAKEPVNVIVQGGDGPVSLLVDEIGDVVEVKEVAFDRPPETLTEAARAMIRGTYKLKDRLLIILDIDKILTPDAAETAPARHGPSRPPSPGTGTLEQAP